jgi:predicted dehydrogenase
MSTKLTRREFTLGAAALGAGALAAPARLRAAGANERIRLGLIGVGNRGEQLIDAFVVHKDCEIAAICDVYAPYLEFAKAKLGGAPDGYGDYRTMLERKDLDAVVIATPDHWHALQFVDACRAGKDVYVEKPLCLVIGEGRRMVEVAAETKRVTQVGTHRRSSDVMREATQLVQGGTIGHVTFAQCFYRNSLDPMGIGSPPDCDPPAGLDWDRWLGPAPKVPYNPNRCFYKFRWFREYSGGQMTNFGHHFLDLIQWGLGQDAPKAVVAMGGQFGTTDNRTIPDTLHVTYEYPGGTLVTFTQTDCSSAEYNKHNAFVVFRGTHGTLYVNYGGYVLEPEPVREVPYPAIDPRDRRASATVRGKVKEVIEARKGKGPEPTPAHARNFLDCIKSRQETNCPVRIGHRSTSTTLLANVAYDRKRRIEWDAGSERVTNDAEANKLLTYDYRPPWSLS